MRRNRAGPRGENLRSARQLAPETMAEFVFPTKPELLLDPDCESDLRVMSDLRVAEMPSEESGQMVEGAWLHSPLHASITASAYCAWHQSPPAPGGPVHPGRVAKHSRAGAELCYDICEADPLCIGEQNFIDRVFGMIRRGPPRSLLDDRDHCCSKATLPTVFPAVINHVLTPVKGDLCYTWHHYPQDAPRQCAGTSRSCSPCRGSGSSTLWCPTCRC